LARAVRAIAVGAPIVAAIACSSLVSHALPTPTSTAALVSWWALVLVVPTVALVVTDRFARRLLPLSVLLKLSLPFPEAPPSRIRVAIRSGSPKQLEKWAQSVRARGKKDPKALAAHELLGLVSALSVHDRRSRGHSERVRVYTDLMVEQLGLSRDEGDKLRWASLLHDVGKVYVPADILNKTGPPSPSEWAIIRLHPANGDRLIEPVRAWLGPWARAVVDHHERWDGMGYPRGLAGTDISLAGRIVAVTDSYEVMTATRSYKKPMSVKDARAELTRSAGTHFDPAMVRAFLNVPIGRMRWTAGPIVWLAQLPFLAQIPTLGATAAVATSVVAAAPMVGFVPVQAPPPTVAVVDTSTPTVDLTSGTPVVRVTTTTVRAGGPATDGTTGANTGGNATGNPTGGKPNGDPGNPRQNTTTTTTTTTTTLPTDVTTTTKPGNGNGRGNGNGGGPGKNGSAPN